jgi:hypothetical protein
MQATAISGSWAATVLRYEPKVEQLTGTVKMERHYGPPNYGENPQTDSVLIVPVLVLDAPVTVQGSPAASGLDTTTYPHVTKMQLVFSKPGTPVKAFNGEKVTVTGKLFEKVTGGDFTDVLVMVEGITPGVSQAR